MQPVTLEELAAQNTRHLKFLEQWSSKVKELTYIGVDIGKVHTYDLIQVLNDAWLQARLSPGKES